MPRRRVSVELERHTQRRLIDALQWHGYIVAVTPVLHGVLHADDGRKWRVDLGEPGQPDLIAVPREHGWRIEVKRPGERPDPHQAAWHAEARARGERVIVARDESDLKAEGMW